MRIAVPQAHMGFPQAHVREAYAPDIVKVGTAFSDMTYQASTLSLREFEAARARTAWINGCVFCQAFRTGEHLAGSLARRGAQARADGDVTRNGPAPDETFYAAVPDWRDSPLFSERERVALEYAEGLGLDPQGIAADEAFWKRTKALFTDYEIVDLLYCIACWIGTGRVTHVLGMDSLCALPAARP